MLTWILPDHFGYQQNQFEVFKIKIFHLKRKARSSRKVKQDPIKAWFHKNFYVFSLTFTNYQNNETNTKGDLITYSNAYYMGISL